MALKDLVAEAAELTEEAIERIVVDYIRFDVGRRSLVLLPAAAALSNRAKVLVYLTALNGWQFVTDEHVAADARPSELEGVLGIPGGSLRPVLRDLAERHFLNDVDGRYSVRPTTFPAIEASLRGEEGPASSGGARRRGKAKRPSKKSDAVEIDESSEGDESVAADDSEAPNAKRQKRGAGIGQKFQSLIDGGFFDEPRTLADVQKQFRRQGLIVPQTSFPIYLLRAIRSDKLERDEAEIEGKTVWVYSVPTKDKASRR